MRNDCIFCAIIDGEIPSTKVYESENILAFRDINPQAPVHVLIAPKTHICSADEINSDNSAFIADIFERIPAIAASEGLTNGYRVINNCGEEGGQSVKHIHFHLIGGRNLGEKII